VQVYQVDVASNLYFAYQGLCLFFTTPLALYSTPVVARTLRRSCRIPKLEFVCMFLVLWWGYQYLFRLVDSLQLDLYLHNIRNDVRIVIVQL
jgi:hypothetical protein